MDVVIVILNTLAQVVMIFSLVYFLAMMGAGIHENRKLGSKLGDQSRTRYEDPFIDNPETFDVYVMIPCLNEEAVIGPTVAALRNGARVTTIVIDDASDDSTSEIARREGGENTIVLRRELPDARTGKGEALNDAYRLVRRLVAEREQDTSRVIILVMDADGRLSDGALSHVLPLFEEPKVGGVQLPVRIRNRSKNFLTRFQDFQFWSMSAVTQVGRRKIGTVSLGGNGQFTRMAALEGLNAMPWSSSLTEDLDLAVSLSNDGWELTTTPFASVDQQAVESLRRLIVQRRRWYQGHMMAGKRLPEIWTNPKLSVAKVLELTGYLIVPWIFDLPWSILSHWVLFLSLTTVASSVTVVVGPLTVTVAVLTWYLLTFAPALFTSWVYLRRDPECSPWRALLIGHSFVVMNYLSYICAWGALIRIIQRKNGWDKTKRTVEAPVSGLVDTQV
ncbi:glycosyltransferase family 2 protein [Leifsonia sp. fls2-241-R2A-40a]|uniref:glycosyltransferase family 2 protein n=1 Tax=Leifsonia sp. fls2-241-R2A-40a TaxID=3040290 RepID=UPI00254FCEC0|nr:glycosyltransferase family 2 protein [Leifsonia sp. fls2-241-R2A-40a]